MPIFSSASRHSYVLCCTVLYCTVLYCTPSQDCRAKTGRWRALFFLRKMKVLVSNQTHTTHILIRDAILRCTADQNSKMRSASLQLALSAAQCCDTSDSSHDLLLLRFKFRVSIRP